MLGYFSHLISSGVQPYAQIFFYRQLGKNISPLWYITYSQPCSSFCGLPGKIITFEYNVARLYSFQTHNRFKQSSFTNTVSPHQTNTGPARDVNIDIPKRMALAIILIKSLDIQHGYSPR